jgi:hypothetical protein
LKKTEAATIWSAKTSRAKQTFAGFALDLGIPMAHHGVYYNFVMFFKNKLGLDAFFVLTEHNLN